MPAPTPDHHDVSLVAWEAELEALLIEWADMLVTRTGMMGG